MCDPFSRPTQTIFALGYAVQPTDTAREAINSTKAAVLPALTATTRTLAQRAHVLTAVGLAQVSSASSRSLLGVGGGASSALPSARSSVSGDAGVKVMQCTSTITSTAL